MAKHVMLIRGMGLLLGMLLCLAVVQVDRGYADECDDLLNGYMKTIKSYPKFYYGNLNKVIKKNVSDAKSVIKENDIRKEIKKMKNKDRTAKVKQMVQSMGSGLADATVRPLYDFEQKVSRSVYNEIRKANNKVYKALKQGVCEKK